jgi:ribosomal protein S18 acetylase RimI-like enzyme
VFSIAKIRNCEIPEIVEIHLKSFPNFFLSNLGKDVLFHFYSQLLQENNTISFCVKNNKKNIGFVFASTRTEGMYTRIFKHGFSKFFLPLILSFFKNPNLFNRMIISYISTRKHKLNTSIPASILSICVIPESAGRGIGKVLLDKLENELIRLGLNGYYLTTDADNNDLTNRFYLKNDFRLNSTFSQGKRRMNLYLKDL